jgi:hypothetical protein
MNNKVSRVGIFVWNQDPGIWIGNKLSLPLSLTKSSILL